MTKTPKIKTFYNDKLNFTNANSESPFISDKPKRVINYLIDCNLFHNFELIEDFTPYSKQDFYTAHHKEWVDDFFAGKGRLQRRNMLGISWSEEFVESERYSNSSLYHAIKYSIHNPAQVCFSPTNGFHHAIPKMGALFCAFSGQVRAIRLSSTNTDCFPANGQYPAGKHSNAWLLKIPVTEAQN